MMRIVLILSSLWLVMASAAPISFEVGNQSDCLDDTEIKNEAGITDQSAAGACSGGPVITENGTAGLTGGIIEAAGCTYFGDTASAPVSGEIVIEAAGGTTGQSPTPESPDDYAVAYAFAEAKDGESAVDHDCSIARNEDGSVSGFAESFAQATSGDNGYAKAVSIVISDGGNVGSSVAIARAE